jgi:N-terminal domain of anti-restriction factor ArdC
MDKNEKRQKMAQLAARFRGMTPEALQAMLGDRAIRTIGQSLSIHNQCMIAAQFPEATLVGGFNAWKKRGRHVKKGERGLCIWAPCTRKPDDDSPAILRGFRLDHVWDIRQTAEIEP